MEYFELNNGTKIPKMGLGVYKLTPSEADNSTEIALRNGYSLIDTANFYMNEKAVGRGIKNSSVGRNKVYLSTKLWPSVYKKADEAIEETMKRLQVHSIDLLFLHQPVGDYISAYKAIERAVKDGKVKSIGLSNFDIEKTQEIIDKCEIKPAVMQIECHPYYTPIEMIDYLKKQDIRIMSWYPLGHGDVNMLEEPILFELAEKYAKTTAQIILRWHIQNGFVVIPGSRNEEHILQNANIFDFEIDKMDMAKIADINKGKPYLKLNKLALKSLLLFRPDFEAQE